MSRKIEIVDLFAGPGGLGEGFSAAGRETITPMSIRLSVEKDDFAIQTLRLRAFLRSFDDGFPAPYYKALNHSRCLPDWRETYPANWKKAVDEAQQLELGTAGVFDHLAPILDGARERCGGRTVLIGGPPCQAYSLAGRSRNAGKKDYVAESDGRHFLYREYVAILDRLKPAAFVMENVPARTTPVTEVSLIAFGAVLAVPGLIGAYVKGIVPWTVRNSFERSITTKNTVTLVGFVSNTSKVRITQSGGLITTVSLATTRSFKDGECNRQSETEWHQPLRLRDHRRERRLPRQGQGIVRGRALEAALEVAPPRFIQT